MGKHIETIEDVIADMTRLQAKLPARPAPQEVQIAQQTVARVDGSLASRLEELFQRPRPPGVPQHVFRAYLEMREDLIREQAAAEKRMAKATLALEERHRNFHSLIEKAQNAASHPLNNGAVVNGSAYDYKDNGSPTTDCPKSSSLPSVSEDSDIPDGGTLLTIKRSLSQGRLDAQSWKASPAPVNDRVQGYTESTDAASKPRPTEPDALTSDGAGEGLQQISPQLLAILARAEAKSLETLKLNNMDLTRLPEAIGNLKNLTSLDIAGNRLEALPESIGELDRLTCLDAQSNMLKSLPDALGCLTNLEHLDIKNNKIEEVPYTIGLCTRLVEFNAEFNHLKALPEAMGHLTSLQRLTVHINTLTSLPTTFSSLTNLRELDVHHNQLANIPESLCLLTNLAKLDISSNFTELRELPQSIGNLQNLRELNVSWNHISVLPDSFCMLTGLKKLELDGNPWIRPPLQKTQEGLEAVLQFMKEDVEDRKNEGKFQTKKGSLGSLLSVFKKNKSSKYNVKEDKYLHIKA